jgi:hypothetical protein
MAPKEPSASGIYVSPEFRERLLLELFSRSGEAARLPQRELGGSRVIWTGFAVIRNCVQAQGRDALSKHTTEVRLQEHGGNEAFRHMN